MGSHDYCIVSLIEHAISRIHMPTSLIQLVFSREGRISFPGNFPVSCSNCDSTATVCALASRVSKIPYRGLRGSLIPCSVLLETRTTQNYYDRRTNATRGRNSQTAIRYLCFLKNYPAFKAVCGGTIHSQIYPQILKGILIGSFRLGSNFLSLIYALTQISDFAKVLRGSY